MKFKPCRDSEVCRKSEIPSRPVVSSTDFIWRALYDNMRIQAYVRYSAEIAAILPQFILNFVISGGVQCAIALAVAQDFMAEVDEFKIIKVHSAHVHTRTRTPDSHRMFITL